MNSRRGRRVVITGMGLVTPLGCTKHHVWNQLIHKQSGVSRKVYAEHPNLPSKVAASVPRSPQPSSFNAADHLSPSQIKRLPLFIQYALSATHLALQDSNLLSIIQDPSSSSWLSRVGVCVGSGIGSLDQIYNNHNLLNGSPDGSGGYNKLSPYFVPNILINMASGNISLEYGLRGPNHAAVTACATGANSIGDGFRFIQDDYADVMVCGGTEACVDPLAIAGFSRLRALSRGFNDTPERASRPFDRDRDGFVIGEGSSILILEELEHALQRNADIYAEIVGYGLSCDGFHITKPEPSGRGAKDSMSMAIRHSCALAEEIGYVNAHATSTPVGDEIEAKAIYELFYGDAAENRSPLHVSSSKGATGHLLGASGSLEAAITALSIKYQCIPPNINLDEIDLGFSEWKDKLVFPTSPEEQPIEYALTNSFGFGGINVSLLLKRYS